MKNAEKFYVHKNESEQEVLCWELHTDPTSKIVLIIYQIKLLKTKKKLETT